MRTRISPILYPATLSDDAELIEAYRLEGFWPIVVNDAYVPNFNHTSRIQIWYGGSGSGKSDAKATELLLKCLCDPYRRVIFMRKYKVQIRDSQFLLFKDLIKRYGLEPFFHVKEAEMDIHCFNGNTLLSAGLDDVDKLKSLPDITDAWIEEPLDKKGSIQATDFTELNRRLRSPKASNHIHFTFNPISRDSWIHDFFFKSNMYEANVLCTTYQDNFFVPEDQVRQFEILKEVAPEEYKVYALGHWGSLRQGLVFPEYTIVDEFPTDCRKHGRGLDWGFFPDPCAIVHCGVKDGVLYLDEELYEQNHTSGSRAEAMRKMGMRAQDKFVADRNPEAIAELKLKGFPNIVPAKKGPGSVKAGVDTMKGFKIAITRRSKNLKIELDNYSWEVDRMSGKPTGDPEDAYNHAIDAARYWVMEEYPKARGVYFAN